jgi:7-cyano-7-deazaguanine synthase in queuosine biosynthesis
VEVKESRFWNSISSKLDGALCHLGGDHWTLRFREGNDTKLIPPMFEHAPDSPLVCLYSGGLDSAAGLARRIREAADIVAVTIWHQAGQRKRVHEQLALLSKLAKRIITPVTVRAALINPPRLDEQEVSQRCRGFLFTSLGAAVASLCGSDRVEVYESGVGALNLPPMAGMISGGRATRGCHPAFLRSMSEIASLVADRQITFTLPYRAFTKGEVVQVLNQDVLRTLALSTVSCVHFPLREKGTAKQCGLCMGCLGRRQAMEIAGIKEPEGTYKFDFFRSVDELAASDPERLLPLRATLMQVVALEKLSDDGIHPDSFNRFVRGTKVLLPGEPIEAWVALMRRYRDEWKRIVSRPDLRETNWAKWMHTAPVAA